MITLVQADELLTAWDERLRRVDENLLALEGDATYQMLAGRAGKRASLEGVTRAQVDPALDAVGQLFDDRERLRVVIDRARELRAGLSSMTFWGKDDKLLELERLLSGRSIVTGTQVTPLARRSLLDGGPTELTVAPDALLAAMASSFERTRDVFMAVSRAWNDLEPGLSRAEAEAGALRQQAASLGQSASDLAELGAVEAELTRLRDRVAKDPLAAQLGMDQGLGPKLSRLRARLSAAAATRDRVSAGLTRAAGQGREAALIHAAAASAMDRLFVEVEVGAGARGLLLDPELLEGLDTWLRKLEASAQSGQWASAEAGLDRWFKAAEQYMQKDRSAIQRVDALLGKRTELAGRLSARRAQALALAGRGISLPPAALALGDEAAALLQRRPTPIAQAAGAVEAYEDAVVAAARR